MDIYQILGNMPLLPQFTKRTDIRS